MINENENLILRGTPEWDERENRRAEDGCKCICLGPIPKNQAFGERDAHKQRLTPYKRKQT